MIATQAHHVLRLTAALAVLLVQQARAAEPPRDTETCPLSAFTEQMVKSVPDGRTLVLANGQEVRFDGIEVPSLDSAADDGGTAGLAARDALAALVRSQPVILKRRTPSADRYGRVIVQGFINRDGHEYSITETLLAAGHATVRPRGQAGCDAGSLGAERAAKARNLGLWADPYYGIRDAEVPETIALGQFNIVQGRVASVRETGGTIYVNFGKRWSEDFTVTILKRNERAFTAAGLGPKTLVGRTIEVRGFAEERGGPWIEAVGPEQIAIMDNR